MLLTSAGRSAFLQGPDSAPGPVLVEPIVQLRRALGDRYAVEPLGHGADTLTHLDTVDGRLAAAGIHLVHTHSARRLVAYRNGTDPVEQPTRALRGPTLPDALPAGPVRSLIEGPAWVRALVPRATSHVDRRSFAVLDAETKTVARVHWWERRLEDPPRPLTLRVEVEPLRGYDSAAAAVRRLLTETLELTDAADGWPAAIPVAPSPRETSSPMRPDRPAAQTVAATLLDRLTEIVGHVDGVVEDIDTEFLHDLRVAVRRSRSILKQLGDLLPAPFVQRYAADLRRLGDRTTPTRDLDVYLLGFADLAALATHPGHLKDFGRHIGVRRAAAQRALARELRSDWFNAMCRDARAELSALAVATPEGGPTVAEVAGERLRRTVRRVLKRSQAIDAQAPSERIHALRKAGKELRYLLEVFRPISDPTAVRKVVADVKRLQDVLGDFQDAEVQAAALREFAAQMMADGAAGADTILAMGELAGRFEDRQQAARERLVADLETSLGPQVTAHVDRLVPA